MRWDRLDEAREAIAQALAALRACGDAWNVAQSLRGLAWVEWNRGDLAAGRELYAQALAGMKDLEDFAGLLKCWGACLSWSLPRATPSKHCV